MNTHRKPGLTAAQYSAPKPTLPISGQTTDSKVKPASEKESPTDGPNLKPVEAAQLLLRVSSFYAKTLLKDPAGLDYLKGCKLDHAPMLEFFRVGYSNDTLQNVLPKAGEVVDGLKALGVLNPRGEEHFRGCITVPIFDAAGVVYGLYGRRITLEEPAHLYLPGPRRGVWNGSAAKTNQVLFICEDILDGLALWQAGFKNVIAMYGTNGWTSDHEELLKDNGVTEVFLCLDNDEAGRIAAQRLKEITLAALVKAIHVVSWPDEVKNVKDFFLSRGPKDFEALLQVFQPKASPVTESAVPAGQEQITMTPDGFKVAYGPRCYDVRAIEKPSSTHLKATIRATSDRGRFVIDTLDLYVSRSRRSFLSEAARLFRETADVVELDLNRIIEQLESYVERRLAEAAPTVTLISDADRAEGLKLGHDPDLTSEIVRDMERVGMIGEAVNKLIGYLAMTSRKLADPLALLVLSGSGAGKSHLQDTVLSLCPDEDLIKLTSLTDRALFYKGEDSLKHKVLAVEELAGAAGADYAIRNLISAKKLVIESTVKNPLTGKLETQVNTVHGPTAVFQTTTNPRTDAETRSRFILVSVDESPEQTRAILRVQRQSHTLEGWHQRQSREAILRRHHAFQRLLKPLVVVNPFEPLLSYPDEQLLVRRDHPKYLHLILAVSFLHQCQRPVKHDLHVGDYIQTTLQDIGIANDIAHQLFGHSLDDLSPPSRELLALIADYAARKAAGSSGTGDLASYPARGAPTFNRRELREAFKWGDTRLRSHLRELVELEYVVPVSGRFGQTYQYRLSCTPNQQPGRFLAGLKSVEQLRQEANLAGILLNLAPTSQVPRREVQSVQSPCQHGRLEQSPANLTPISEEHICASCKNNSNGGAHTHNRRR
jgi:hypothetical protein